VIASKTSLGSEEAFMTMGKLMDKMEGRFERYLGATMPLLITALQNSEDYQVLSMCQIR
jgi:hypothetical protein